MPGPNPTNPEPFAFLVEVPPTAGPLWFDVEIPMHRIEAFPMVDGVASPQWVDIPQRRIVPYAQTFALPVGARKLNLYDPTGEPVFKSIRPGLDGRTRFLFVSEGFGDDGQQQFFDACETMAARMLNIDPFKGAASSIRIDGLFLPLRGGAVVNIKCSRSAADQARLQPTLFGTQSCLSPATEQLWGGDEDRVRTLVARALVKKGENLISEIDFLAVLINSPDYGGAGSSGPADVKPRIAWATTGNPLSIEILLHELGHAFGLQDEYITAYKEPVKPWRNISDHPEPKNTPWQSLVNRDRDQLTLAKDGHWTGKPNDVGTFEGAGYQPDHRYRPSHDCRMRNLGQHFCPVCSDVILSGLDPAVHGRVGKET